LESFANQIAVVTGGGSGIGRALVQQLTAAGCNVALCDISEVDMAGTVASCQAAIDQGVRVTAHRCDVASEAELLAFQRQVAQQHDSAHINLLFNNAGVSGGQSFLDDSREQWDRVFNICWGGVYLGCRVFMPMLLASERGHIINTSSINGFWACMGANMEHTAYSAATTAERAAQIILAGVLEGQWRILVGDDAVRLDQAVRDNPEAAYEPGVIQLLASNGK
jgi:NAD(P)-dependent dehydrogenase (short-subunit alcohol dehydrogenase family)